MSETVNTRTIDHIVHLTPPGSVDGVSEKFRELGFTVLRGGTHADGLTTNALVILGDGSYLELISFVHPASHYPANSPERPKREKHRWAKQPPGWIDYAFLGNGSRQTRISDIINRRTETEGSGVFYLPEQDGGRVRPDGEVLKWLISAPQVDQPGTLPFFCGDVTARALRVPTDPPSNTHHSSTAEGVALLRSLTTADAFATTRDRLTTVIGHKPVSVSGVQAIWILDTPIPSNELKPRLILDVAATEEEVALLVASATTTRVYEVGFYVRRSSSQNILLRRLGRSDGSNSLRPNLEQGQE